MDAEDQRDHTEEAANKALTESEQDWVDLLTAGTEHGDRNPHWHCSSQDTRPCPTGEHTNPFIPKNPLYPSGRWVPTTDIALITVGELAKELGFGEDIEAFKAWVGDMPKFADANAFLTRHYADELRAAMRYQRENESKD